MDGKKIAEFRKKKGFTQEELAEKIGVERSYISKLENGKAKTSVRRLEMIADVLGKSIKDFF